ncbi:MAG: sodium:solute symporter, partial [Bacteroidales bacterium]|nr:sodium:solute symporter [Bacteroidales bacterium]
GMFTFGIFTKIEVKDKAVPYISILSPLICLGVTFFCDKALNYEFGYELLIFNGMITFLGLYLFRKKSIDLIPS